MQALSLFQPSKLAAMKTLYTSVMLYQLSHEA